MAFCGQRMQIVCDNSISQKKMHYFGNFILQLQTIQITLGHFKHFFWIVHLLNVEILVRIHTDIGESRHCIGSPGIHVSLHFLQLLKYP